MTDDQSLSSDKTTWSPETIDAFITVGDNRPADLGGPAGNGYLAKITVLPGETKLVTTSNSVAWQQVFFVHFKVMWRGQLTIFSTKNMCACESAAPAETTTSTSSTSSTTSTSTSTTSTSTTTSTSVPASSTTSSTSSTTSTSTSTTSSSTTTSSSVPESTTTTTEFIIPG